LILPPPCSKPLDLLSPPSLTLSLIVNEIRSVFSRLTDTRQHSNNLSYHIEDFALSAFSVFFTQCPSFLDHQTQMQLTRGRNNAQSVFGMHQIPKTSQMRRVLDPVLPSELYPLFTLIGHELREQGYLQPFKSINQTFLLALDGTTFFSSSKISCSSCSTKTLKNGEKRYQHIAVTPMLVAPDQEHVIPLPPEFVHPQDGHEKQDCELAAAQRWLGQHGPHYIPWGVTFLGDDLYSHQPFCQKVIDTGAHFIFVCKPDSHSELYEWVGDFERSGDITTLVHTRWTGKKRLTDTYRFMNQVPLRNSDDALMVNWFELTTATQSGDIVYRNSWATSHEVRTDNMEAMAAAARSRWNIENGGNNILKTKGYHFEHNFGHGEQNLSNVLATMILLAYLTHTVLDWVDERYRTIRSRLSSRRTFFENIRSLLNFIPFDNWDHLMEFMLNGLQPYNSS
jgi:hypothetical protein